MISSLRSSGSLWPVLVLVALAGCGGKGPKDNPAAGRASAAEGRPADPALPAMPVAVQPSERGTISSYYSTTATLEPSKQADILARVPGIITGIEAEEGDFVRAGQDLLRIQDDEYRYRLDQADAEKERQQAVFERTKKMFQDKLVSAEQFETVQTDLKAAEAAEALAALEVSYTKVTAPFTGRIVRRAVDPGQNISNGTVLFTIADMNPLLARVYVPAKEFRSIRQDQPVELSLDATPQPLQGTITLVSPIVDPASGTIKVTVEIRDYPPSARPGDFAQVRIVTDRHAGAVLVPKAAVLTDKGDQVVFVAADSLAERRVVQVGFQDDRSAEITAGLAEGENVVVQGQRSLKQGQPLKILAPTVFEAGPADSSAKRFAS
jgi:membrane fusion protein (multidrug efflux system)